MITCHHRPPLSHASPFIVRVPEQAFLVIIVVRIVALQAVIGASHNLWLSWRFGRRAGQVGWDRNFVLRVVQKSSVLSVRCFYTWLISIKRMLLLMIGSYDELMRILIESIHLPSSSVMSSTLASVTLFVAESSKRLSVRPSPLTVEEFMNFQLVV